MSSMLLDPHHQPSASALRSSPRGASHGRYAPRLNNVTSPTGHAGARIEEESSIGDSWRTSRLAQDDEDEEEGTGARGGVLQLLQQFSRAQAEGRGAGVGV